MNLTEHFTLEEMCVSQTAARQRIDNRPGTVEVKNLYRTAELLEEVRALVGRPVSVSSGYRSRDVNAAVGGSANSAHIKGLAADIIAPGLSAKELAEKIQASGIVFDQLIYEGAWVHISLSDRAPRRQVLTAIFSPRGTVYAPGIA